MAVTWLTGMSADYRKRFPGRVALLVLSGSARLPTEWQTRRRPRLG
jgi:hypothetical protein